MGRLAMRGGFLPPAILVAMIALVLAFIPLRRASVAAGLMIAVALMAWWVGPSTRWLEPIFVGCWLSVIATASLLYRPERLPPWLFLAAAANAGLWAGAVTAVAGRGGDLAIALPIVLLFVVGHPVVLRHWGIGLKVVASWLAAVAILATMVSLTPTPGYQSDHME